MKCLFKGRMFGAWGLMALVLMGGALSEAAGETLRLTADGLSVGLDRDGRGGLVSFKTPGGVELAATPTQVPQLFMLTFSQQAQVPGKEIKLSNVAARSFDAALRKEEGGGTCATLTYGDFEKGIERVVCTVRTRAGESALRWGITVTMAEGWVLENVQYPRLTLAAPLGESVADDAAVVGSSKGGVYRKPGELARGTAVAHHQPGNLAAQFGCYYDDRAGFYTAAEDAKGYPKRLGFMRTGAGVEFSWSRPCFAVGTDVQGYDIVTAAFSGTDGTATDWRDAADLYKAWALKQPWCAVPFTQRTDLPAWLKDGPAMARFQRNWLDEPERIERWITEYWKKHFPAAPLITAYWGWEKWGNWVTPDYFPIYPSDEVFTNLVAKTRELGCHAFPWPSGYHWTLTYNKRADGSFVLDDRERFDAVARTHAVHQRDGSLYIRVPSWLKGGDTACLCGGDPWTINWWNEEVCVPLAQRGCELVQIDQVVGGGWPTCYADGHGHPKGRGQWMTEAFNRQLTTMREAMRRVEPDAVVCFEEPNEWFNHIVGLQDYRNCEVPREWASVFNYLYHEFLPPFQSNPRDNDRVRFAHCVADGQMPHLVPSASDLTEEVLVNGGFEPRRAGEDSLRGWTRMQGSKDRILTGEAFGDSLEKHSGMMSLRLLNTNTGDVQQVAQNVPVRDNGLAVGGRYRLSAWLKTGRMARANWVNFTVFAPGLKSTGQGGQFKFPAVGSGWQRMSSEFTVPKGAEMLRIMINLAGEAEAWVDDVTLEVVADDGSARPVRIEGLPVDARFMRNWVALYHGEGRPWLMYGRMLHPPRLECETITYSMPRRGHPSVPITMPAVFHNAFRAPDGSEAVVLANATRERQKTTLFWRGRAHEVVLEADGISIISGEK